MKIWKRGFIEIVGEILECLSKNPLKKSHISNQCNLDARVVTKYLNLMIELNLAEQSKDIKHYKITPKGIKFLGKYDTLTQFLQKDLKKDHELTELHLHKPQINN